MVLAISDNQHFDPQNSGRFYPISVDPIVRMNLDLLNLINGY